MSNGYRQGRPQDEQHILDMANMVFSMEREPHDFAALLPKVYGQPGFGEKHVLFEDGQGSIRALAALHVVNLRLGGQRLRCGLVGTVATHPAHRGQGHMQQIMRMLEELANANGCEVMLLEGERLRYNRLGYEQGGIKAILNVTSKSLEHLVLPPRVDIAFVPLEQAGTADLQTVHQLCQAQDMVCERPDDLLATVLRSWHGQGYAIVRQGDVMGYLYEVDGVWEEFALTDEAMLPAVLLAWQKHKGTARTLITLGLHQRKLLAQLGVIAEDTSVKDSMMVRVLCWQSTLQKVLAYRHSQVAVEEGDIMVEIDGECLRIQTSAHGVMVKPTKNRPMVRMTHHQAVSRLFSVQGGWQTGAKALHDWVPLWFTLPRADAF